MSISIDRNKLIRTLADMVRIDSVNPDLVPGGAGETHIADYVAGVMRDIGLDTKIYTLGPGRANAVGVLKGAGGGRSLMLNGHIDTVGVEGMAEPFSAAVREGRLYGRGGFDMKGGVAAMLAAARALVESGTRLAGDLVLAAVADEEYASIGTEDVVKRYHTDGAIVTEPTGLDICRAHKGFAWLEVETVGRAAHGSLFDEGIDANMHMGRFLAELDHLRGELVARTPHPLVGPPSLHAALLAGGSALSMYAAHCSLKIERRTVPGETVSSVTAEIQAIIDRLAAADPTFKATVKLLFARGPFEAAADSPIVRAVVDSATAVRGEPPVQFGVMAWMDSALLADAGIETVIFGPEGDGAHAAEEWVDLGSVVQTADVLARAAAAYCGTA